MKFKRMNAALLSALACCLSASNTGGYSGHITDKSPYAFASKRKTKSKANTVSQKKKRLNARRLGR